MSSIKVKTVDELKRERQRKETEEKMKEDEEKLQAIQKDLDIRHELMKRILAEKMSFKKRQEKECEGGEARKEVEVATVEKTKGVSERTSALELPSSDYISLVASKEPGEDSSKRKRRERPKDLKFLLSSRKNKTSAAARNGQNISDRKRKLSKDHSRSSGRSRGHAKVCGASEIENIIPGKVVYT